MHRSVWFWITLNSPGKEPAAILLELKSSCCINMDDKIYSQLSVSVNIMSCIVDLYRKTKLFSSQNLHEGRDVGVREPAVVKRTVAMCPIIASSSISASIKVGGDIQVRTVMRRLLGYEFRSWKPAKKPLDKSVVAQQFVRPEPKRESLAVAERGRKLRARIILRQQNIGWKSSKRKMTSEYADSFVSSMSRSKWTSYVKYQSVLICPELIYFSLNAFNIKK